MKHDDRYIWMDLIRGFSALLVCTTHLRAAMFINYSDIAASSILEQIFYFMTGFGHQAVMVFFVLSGFFVGGSILKNYNKFSFKQYFIARLSRLWMVLIPMLILTLIIDKIIGIYLPLLLDGEHLTNLNSGPTSDYSTSLKTFLGNVFFLQTIFTPVFGSNGPLWSLANEFWYYVIFPLLIIVIGRIEASILSRIIYGLILIVLFSIASVSILEGFLVWLMGVFVFFCYNKKLIKISSLFFTVSTLLFAAAMVDSKVHIINNVFGISSDLFIAITFSLFLIAIQNKSIPRKFYQEISAFARWLSDISFTMYLAHFPLIMLIYSFNYSEVQESLNMFSFAQYILCILVILGISHLLWWTFERNTPQVRGFLTRNLIKEN